MTPPNISYHEWVHANACRGEGDPFWWEDRRGEPVVTGHIGWGRASIERSAVELCAGALAGGGDAADDWEAARGLAHEVAVPMAEIEARASRYLDRGAWERETSKGQERER